MTRRHILKPATAIFAFATVTAFSVACSSPPPSSSAVGQTAPAVTTPYQVDTVDGLFPYDVSNPQMVAFQADTVVVGTVTEKLVSTSRMGAIPETQHKIHVNSVLKGDVGEEIIVSQTGGISEDTNTLTILDDVPLLDVGSAYVLSLVFDPAVNFYTVIAFAGQQEIPVDEAKAIEEAPQQRGGTANEPEAVTVMRDAIADPVDPFTTE